MHRLLLDLGKMCILMMKYVKKLYLLEEHFIKQCI